MLLTDFPSGSLPRRAWPASHIVRWSEWDDTSADMTAPQVLESYSNIINQPQEHWTLRIVVTKSHSAPVGICCMWKHALLKCVGDVNQCKYCPKVWGMLLFLLLFQSVRGLYCRVAAATVALDLEYGKQQKGTHEMSMRFWYTALELEKRNMLLYLGGIETTRNKLLAVK